MCFIICLLSLATSVVEGKRRSSCEERRVPVRIRRAIDRGLRREPEARWPSMKALLGQLGAARAPVQPRWAAFGLGLAGVLAGAMWPDDPDEGDARTETPSSIVQRDSVQRTTSLLARAQALHATGRLDDAQAKGQEALVMAEATDDPSLLARALVALALTETARGEPETARELLTRAMAVLDQASTP